MMELAMGALGAFNGLIDWMIDTFGLNDYAAVTLLVVLPSAIYAKASEAWEKRKEKKAATKQH